MKSVIAITLFIACALALTEVEYQNQFTQWMQLNQKSYHHEEFQARYGIWKSNLDYINNFNSKYAHMTLAMNKFGDLSLAEFSSIYLGTHFTADVSKFSANKTKVLPSAPTSYDWRKHNAVTGVKNQEQCGSCWSFSTTGSTEGCWAISGHSLVGLSEQNLMDCSWSQGNQGCDGGLMTDAMNYIISNNGIDSESSYPYTAQDGTCHYSVSNKAATLSSYTNVQSGDENDLLNKNTKGPVSVAIDASHSSFQFYSSGVYYEPDCSTSQLDHGVLSVGWGVSNSEDYWIVKNSWGSDWGMQGYIWMSRNRNNNCGIATMATLPSC